MGDFTPKKESHSWTSHVTHVSTGAAGYPCTAPRVIVGNGDQAVQVCVNTCVIQFVFVFAIWICMWLDSCVWQIGALCYCGYWVATISRLLKIIGFFFKRALQKRRYSAKETYDFEEPTNRSHPILEIKKRRFVRLHVWHAALAGMCVYVCDIYVCDMIPVCEALVSRVMMGDDDQITQVYARTCVTCCICRYVCVCVWHICDMIRVCDNLVSRVMMGDGDLTVQVRACTRATWRIRRYVCVYAWHGSM